MKAWLPEVRKIFGQANEISEKKIRPKNVTRNLSDMWDELVLNIGDRCQHAGGASHTIASSVSFSWPNSETIYYNNLRNLSDTHMWDTKAFNIGTSCQHAQYDLDVSYILLFAS